MFDHIYCGCFSDSEDDLSQWRGYADDGRGVALELDMNALLNCNGPSVLQCEKVRYIEKEQKQEALKVIRKWTDQINEHDTVANAEVLADNAYDALSQLAAACKNPEFEAEQEWRLIARPRSDGPVPDPTRHDCDVLRDFRGEIDVFERNGTLVPYTKIRFPHDAIKSVWLGPRFGNVQNEEALKFLLSKNSVRATVHRSKATYCGSDGRPR